MNTTTTRRTRRVLGVGALVGGILVANSQASAAPAAAGASYLVVFHRGVEPTAAAHGVAAAHGLEAGFVYRYALSGMSAVVPDGRLDALRHDPRVAYVEADRVHSIEAQSTPTGIQRTFAVVNPNLTIDGVDDQRVDVDVAVIDTGVDLQQPDLNVRTGVNCTGGIFFATCTSGGDDDHYHGTHVAGTIGALDNGIGVVGMAPGARLWPVKVLNSQGSGYTSWIVAGIDWVARNASTIEVANMSLGGSGFSRAEYDAIQGAVSKGVAFAVAAGNNAADATGYSPGGFDNVLSVSALADFDGTPGGLAGSTCRTDEDDTLAAFSNWGSAIDVAAPGVCILSTYPIEKGSYGTISGTSMASPHGAGALALLASQSKPTSAAGVYALYGKVKAAGNFEWTDDSGDGVQEPLLDVHDTSLFAPRMLAVGGGGSTAMSVEDLDATKTIAKRSWKATVTITVKAAETAVAGATVAGDFNGVAVSCTTGSAGTCSVSATAKTGVTSMTYTVTTVTATGFTYDASANSDPDDDSNGTSITISR